jgi:hypothetical protein
MPTHARPTLAAAVSAVLLSGCAALQAGSAPPAAAQTAAAAPSPAAAAASAPVGAATAAAPSAAAPAGIGGYPPSKRNLADFRKGADAPCYDRKAEPFAAVVDAHFHPRPFGGPAIPPAELFQWFDRAGVRFVNYFGIGQVLDLRSKCTYYLDCPGVAATPSIKNDFVNGMEVAAYAHPNVHVTLSMTFMDLAKPEDIVRTIELYDREYPGMFKWAGELNVVKQALVGNLHVFATEKDIAKWAPFMKILRERSIPVTLHGDLGNDLNPMQFVPLIHKVLDAYPDNKIVWAHMGLSKELKTMDPGKHVAMMKEAFDKYPNLYVDVSWDVLYQSYHQFGPIYVEFFNRYPDRILPGTDFVAAGTKDYAKYANELDVTSRVNKFLSDEAFRKIALGENYFRLMGVDYVAPQICAAPPPAAAAAAQ